MEVHIIIARVHLWRTVIIRQHFLFADYPSSCLWLASLSHYTRAVSDLRGCFVMSAVSAVPVGTNHRDMHGFIQFFSVMTFNLFRVVN